MRSRSKVGFITVLFAFVCAIFPSGGMWAQPPASNPLDQLTAPIALYPDALVIQIMKASKNYDALKTFDGWMKNNNKLKGTELQAAAVFVGRRRRMRGIINGLTAGRRRRYWVAAGEAAEASGERGSRVVPCPVGEERG